MENMPSEKEVNAHFEKIMEVYECYRFLVSNADDEHLKKKITEIAREHLVSKIREIEYITLIAVQIKKDELLKKMAELGKD
jgi:hypothetical protein